MESSKEYYVYCYGHNKVKIAEHCDQKNAVAEVLQRMQGISEEMKDVVLKKYFNLQEVGNNVQAGN